MDEIWHHIWTHTYLKSSHCELPPSVTSPVLIKTAPSAFFLGVRLTNPAEFYQKGRKEEKCLSCSLLHLRGSDDSDMQTHAETCMDTHMCTHTYTPVLKMCVLLMRHRVISPPSYEFSWVSLTVSLGPRNNRPDWWIPDEKEPSDP